MPVYEINSCRCRSRKSQFDPHLGIVSGAAPGLVGALHENRVPSAEVASAGKRL